jgi:putative ABC transport system permease protein
MTVRAQWSLAWKMARRELRAGLTGFRIFLACLAVGVAAIAGVGTISASVTGGLNADAKNLLGGDIDLRFHNHPNNEEQNRYLKANSNTLSKVMELRAMAAPVGGRNGAARGRSLVELKGVDEAYPLSGAMVLSPDLPLKSALGKLDDGSFGAVVDSNLLKRLVLSSGSSDAYNQAANGLPL